MTCDEVRNALEAFIEGELPEHEGTELIDHLASCPACALESEELTELVGSLRHARTAVRPLHSFEVATLPVTVTKRRRTMRLLWAAAILVGVWAIFCTAALLWPSIGARVAFLRIGHEAGEVTPVTANDDGRQALSLSKVPAAALVEALTSLSSGNGLVLGSSGNQGSAFLPSNRVSVRVTRLGPVVKQSANILRLRAAVDVVKALDGAASVQHLQVVVTLSRHKDGSWAVTRVVTDAP